MSVTPSSLVYRYQHFRRTCTYSFSVAPTLTLEVADSSGTLVPIHQTTWITSLPYACPTSSILFIYLFIYIQVDPKRLENVVDIEQV